jgi:RNA polymerase sigma-70 factor (ECF subfamily)
MGELETDFLEFRTNGSAKAMARVFDAAAPELLLVAGHLARDASSAEDLVQGALLAAIEQRQRFDPSRRLMPWLLGILVNLNRSDRRRPQGSSIPASWPSSEADPPSAAVDAELAQRLDRLLTELPESCREPLRLRLIHGLEPVQIARALGRPLETVRTQLRRGKQHLRDAFPASFAGAFTLDMGLGRDSLSAIREIVLARARDVSGTSLGPLALAGGIAVKKSIAAAAVVVIVAGSFVLTREVERGPLPAVASSTSGQLEPVVPSSDASAHLQPQSSERTTQTAQVEASATWLKCRVSWKTDGQPAVGVGVRLVSAAQLDYGPEPTSVTDSQGIAHFEEALPGAARLYSDRGGVCEVEILSNRRNEAMLEIPQGVLVRGIVLDQDDRPVERAAIWISTRGISMHSGMDWGSSGPDGRFELRDVDSHRVISARLAGFEPSDGWVVVGEPGAVVETTLRIGQRAGRLHGIVRGPDGKPRSEAVVLIGFAMHYQHLLQDGKTGVKPPVWVHTDSEGRFSADVPLGTEVPVWARAIDTAVWNSEFVFEQDENRIEIELEQGAVVRGSVLDRNAAPLAGVNVSAVQDGIGAGPAIVSFFGPWFAIPMTRTDESGQFELSSIKPGRTTVLARDEDGRKVTAELDLGPGDVATCELTMGNEKSIIGIVVDENDTPVAGIAVSARSEDGDQSSLPPVTTGIDGRFELVDAWKERYTLSAQEPRIGVNPYIHAFGVDPGAAPVRIVFATSDLARSRICGQLVDAAGAPVTEGRIALNRIGADGRSQWGGRDTEFEGGRFRTAPLPPGEYVLSYQVDYVGLAWTRNVRLSSDRELDLGVIELPEPGRIELIVTGTFAHEMSATIVKERLPWAIGMELQDGRGLSGPLQPGEYRVGFLGNEGRPFTSEAVQVLAGETASVTLALGPVVRRKVRMPRVLEDDVLLTQTWIDGEGKTIARLCWPVQRRESEVPLEWYLVPGDYRVIVEAADGRRAEATVLVTEAPESDEVIQLPSPVVN